MSEGIYGAVGLLTLRSAAVERTVDALCWVLRNRRRENFETTGRSISEILRELSLLAHAEEEPLRADLLAIKDRVDQLKELRNHVIHGLWTGGEKPDSWVVTRALRVNPVPQAREFTLDSVRDLADSYAEVQDQLIELRLPF